MANFCLNCGKPVPEKAKFCPLCGQHLEQNSADGKPESSPAKNGSATSASRTGQDPLSSYMYTLLDPGAVFAGYKIQRMMNKDNEGIKYIAEKNQKLYILKVFYKSNMANLDSLFAQQMRLAKMNHLQDKGIATVVEVNQKHDPAYMVADYIHGVSLAHLKQHNPEKLNEKFLRHIIPQLIHSAQVIHKHDLSLGKLNLNSVMIDDNDNATILSSSITYDDRDERDDIFNLGALIAQALSQASLYKTLYSQERLQVQKFVFVNGVSKSLNRMLEDCVHRNILQRYTNWQTLSSAFNNLPALESDEIWTQAERPYLTDIELVNAPDKPKTRIEVWFWLLIVLIVTVITMLLTTNIFAVLFGGKQQEIHYTGFLGSAAREDSTEVVREDTPVRADSPKQTSYGELKNSGRSPQTDFRRNIITPEYGTRAQAPSASTPRPPVNMVLIDSPTLGFGRLKDNLQHNVSLSSFYISRHEVTQGEWNKLMKPANCSTLGDKLPVDNVSWFDIAIYCNGRSEAEGLTPAYKIRGVGAARVVTCDFLANGYRLPSEAEWEVAAKAGELFNYSGSDDPAEVAWFKDNSGGKIRQPGGKPANAYGIHDMTGNVAEWCWDWYGANYVRSLPTFINPTGPSTGTTKVIRGGSIDNGEGRNLNVLWREKGDPQRGIQYVGFRLVRSR